MSTKRKVLRGGQKVLGTLSSGAGDDILTRDVTTKEIGVVPPIDPSVYLSTSLLDGKIFVGNSLDLAAAVTPTGAILVDNTGLFSIAPNIITNENIFSGAAIDYSKLNLANSIVNNDIATNANIDRSKIVSGNPYRILINDSTGAFTEQIAITPSRVLISDPNGLPIDSSLTTTVLSYIDPTSSIQNQLNNRLVFSSTIVPAEGDIVAFQSGIWNSFPRGTSGQYLTSTSGGLAWVSTPNGMPSGGAANEVLRKIDSTDYNTEWHTLSISDLTDITANAAQINVLTTGFYDATSSIQTQLGQKLNSALAHNAIFVGNSSDIPSQLSAGSNGQVLSIVGGSPQWQTITGTGTVTSVALSGGTTGLSVTGSPITTSGTIVLTGTLTTANGGTNLTSYTAGDLLYASATNVLSPLNIGTNGYILKVVAGVPSWQANTPASPLTTKGDIYVFGTTDDRLPVGADNDHLVVDSAQPLGIKWAPHISQPFEDNTPLLKNSSDTTKLAQFDASTITTATTRTYTLPDFSGTIALLGANNGVALSKVDDTNITLSLSAGSNTALLNATTITAGWTGTLADGRIASSSNWNTAYTNRITSLTTTGSSGSATLISNTLNIPTYTLSGLGGTTLAAVNAQNLSVFAATTSAQLAGVISDETGTGALVFAGSPAFTGTLTYGTLGYSDTDIAFSFQKSVNSYFQIPIQNTSSGAIASTDIIISSDNGTATTHYLDLGKNSSGFTGSGSLNAAGYSYLTSTTDDLVIGTTTANGLHFVINSGTTDALSINSVGAFSINAAIGTVTANNTYPWSSTVSATSRATASDTQYGYNFVSTTNANAATIDNVGFVIDSYPGALGGIATLNASGAIANEYESKNTTGMTATTYTNVAPASTSGSGTGALFTVIVANATNFTSITMTTAGSGYRVGETVTFNGSQFGSGSGSIVSGIKTVSNTLGANTSALRIFHRQGDVRGLTKRYFDFQGATTGTSFGSLELSQSTTATTRTWTFNDTGGALWSSDGTTFTVARAASLSSTLAVSGTTTLSGNLTVNGGITAATNAANAITFSGALSSSTSASNLNSIKITKTIANLGRISANTATGTGTNGTYTGVALSGGTGSGAIATITVSGGNVVSPVSITTQGTGYTNGDVLTGTITGGTATVTVTGIDWATVVSGFWDNASWTDAKSPMLYYGFYSNPTYNITSTQVGSVAALVHNPTITAVGSFNHYGVIIVPIAARNGWGVTAPTAKMHIGGAMSATTWTTTGIAMAVDAATYTDTGTAGTRATGVAIGIARPTFAGTNAVTVSDAATVYIANDVAAGTNMTLTRTHALWVAAGISRFDGKVQVGSGISADGGGFKHTRVTTGSVAGGSTALVTVTWTTAFADANYTVTADVLDSTTSSLSLSVVHIESVTASAVTVRVLNNAIGALTGTLNVIAIHD